MAERCPHTAPHGVRLLLSHFLTILAGFSVDLLVRKALDLQVSYSHVSEILKVHHMHSVFLD